jgi:integrase/recombinase XerD
LVRCLLGLTRGSFGQKAIHKEATMLINEAVERFKRGLVGKGASENTVATYARHLRLLTEHFNGTKVEEITSADLADFLYAVRLKEDGNPKNQRTINSIKTALKSLFKSLGLKDNPAHDLRIKRVRIERDYITEDEVRVLLAGVDNVRDRAIIAILCFLGLRREELVNLKVGNVQGPALRIFGKGGVERDIPISRSARAYLDQLFRWKEERGQSLDPKAPLFVSRKRNPLSDSQLYNVVRKWTYQLLEKELYPHALRHTFASMLVAKNVNLATIQRLMGHASITMTEVYLHISNELKVEAVEKLAV